MQFILDAAARPRHGSSQRDREQARLEAERVQKPWLERNLPVTPPAHVAASAVASPPKAAAYTAEDFASSGTSDHREEDAAAGRAELQGWVFARCGVCTSR